MLWFVTFLFSGIPNTRGRTHQPCLYKNSFLRSEDRGKDNFQACQTQINWISLRRTSFFPLYQISLAFFTLMLPSVCHLTSCVTLTKVLNLSEPLSSRLYNGNSAYLTLLLSSLEGMMHIKQLTVPSYVYCSKMSALLGLFSQGNEPLPRWLTSAVFCALRPGLPPILFARVVHGHLPLSLIGPASPTAHTYTEPVTHTPGLTQHTLSFLSCK